MTTPARRPAGVHWFLPTNGDARGIVGSAHAKEAAGGTGVSGLREPTVAYLGEVARAADRLGYDAVLTPTGTWCEDAWLTTAALAGQTGGCGSWSRCAPGWCPRRSPRRWPPPCSGSRAGGCC
ncbi:LLM class flavin-dependent oxidoreductase [Promicromonospora sukumoe]|uniref:LLM class flavin-dependent oxidoreductase n=1 Tax=Promicromonospora sukumoe TaxID=88382 RepID=UPI0003A5D76E|nr:LLM class flavin-dependent oxidoreductase [Promicromonospora sukumoe]